jgi:hypothetical protein
LREGELTASGAWSWFGDPRSVYHEGAHRRTFTGWVARDGSVQVASYDHDTGQRVVATLRARLQIDDHNNPSILVRPDGRLLVFWSTPPARRCGTGASARPEDVTAWEPERRLPTNTPGSRGYTYPNPVQLSAEANRIYLFWRGGNFNPSFPTLSAGTSTWSPARTLTPQPDRPAVREARRQRPRHHRHGLHPGHPRPGEPTSTTPPSRPTPTAATGTPAGTAPAGSTASSPAAAGR